MISLKKFLDQNSKESDAEKIVRERIGTPAAYPAVKGSAGSMTSHEEGSAGESGSTLADALLHAYGSALAEVGNSSMEVCPALGDSFRKQLHKASEEIRKRPSEAKVVASESSVRELLSDWGKKTALHYREKTQQVKEMLLVMTRSIESVGERDQRASAEIHQVTSRLRKVADLDDLTEIRSAIEISANELKTSIERMNAEGKAAIAQLRAEITNYQAKLEETELIASSDALTGLRNRMYLESQMEKRMETVLPFCVAVLDINGFKQVNDTYGHLAGDELLKQFSHEMKSICRSTDLIGRWGGDEFVILLDCDWSDAKAQIERLRRQVARSYAITYQNETLRLPIGCSIGLAERNSRETLEALLARADAAMYAEKAASKAEKR